MLGSGKGLAPPAPIRSSTASSASSAVQRATSPFAPSDSTLSLGGSVDSGGSPGTSSPIPGFAQDLSSNVSLGGPSKGGSTATKLVCPICEEEMVSQFLAYLDLKL